MSTLKTSNIQDTSGNNNSTPEEISQGRAKAWANFDGTGTVSIRSSFNIASIIDNATGDYTLTFTTAMTDANYCVVCNTADHGSPKRAMVLYNATAPVNTSVRVAVFKSTTGDLVDEDINSVAVFR